MGQQLDALLEVTINHPDKTPGVAGFMLNRIRCVRVHVRRVTIQRTVFDSD